MFLFEILIAFLGILHVANSSSHRVSEITFKTLLDKCTQNENYNSRECQFILSTYQWQNNEIQCVFNKVLSLNTTDGSPAVQLLKERLIHLIETPNFKLASLGKAPFHSAITHHQEPLAIAIWSHLKTPSDLPLQECRSILLYVVYRDMVHLLKTMLTDRPACLHPDTNALIQKAIQFGNGSAMIEVLSDHGLEITPNDLKYAQMLGKTEIFEWAILKFRHSRQLIQHSFKSYEFLSIDIWEYLKQKNDYSNLLFQICNDTVFEVVNSDKVHLLNTMLRDCPSCIHSNRDSLMDIAKKGGNGLMIHFLNGQEVV